MKCALTTNEFRILYALYEYGAGNFNHLRIHSQVSSRFRDTLMILKNHRLIDKYKENRELVWHLTGEGYRLIKDYTWSQRKEAEYNGCPETR